MPATPGDNFLAARSGQCRTTFCPFPQQSPTARGLCSRRQHLLRRGPRHLTGLAAISETQNWQPRLRQKQTSSSTRWDWNWRCETLQCLGFERGRNVSSAVYRTAHGRVGALSEATLGAARITSKRPTTASSRDSLVTGSAVHALIPPLVHSICSNCLRYQAAQELASAALDHPRGGNPHCWRHGAERRTSQARSTNSAAAWPHHRRTHPRLITVCRGGNQTRPSHWKSLGAPTDCLIHSQ